MAYPSTFQDIQNAVIAKARLHATNDLQKVKDWINQTYGEVCLEAELIVTTSTINLVANTANATMPAAVKRLKSIYLTPAGQSSAFARDPLTRTSLDDILRRRAQGGVTANAGDYSRYFAVIGLTDLELWPTPPAADVLTVFGVNAPTVLAANGDLPVIDEPYASKLLEYGALVQAGDLKGDPSTQEWQSDFDAWMGRFLNHLARQQGEIPGQFRQWGSLDDTRGLYTGGW